MREENWQRLSGQPEVLVPFRKTADIACDYANDQSPTARTEDHSVEWIQHDLHCPAGQRRCVVGERGVGMVEWLAIVRERTPT